MTLEKKKPLPITKVATTDLSELLNPVEGQRMALPGFDAEFVDFPDYIIRITDRIWHCLIYSYQSPRDRTRSRMPSSA